MKKLVVLLFLFVVACGPSGEFTSGTLTGSDGVVVSMVSSPHSIYEGEEFTLTYSLENRGATSVSEDDPGFVFLSYDALYLEYLGLTSRFSQNSFVLDGRTRFFDGEESYINAHFVARDIDRFSREVSTNVLLTACYPYSTNATVDVCIERDRNPDAGAVACRGGPSRPASSAAPIGIEEVEVRTGRTVIGGEEVLAPQFRITLNNYGGGVPSASSCIDGNSSMLNTASVSVSVLNEPLECLSSAGEEGLVRFSRNRVTITCRLADTSDTVFPSSMGNFMSLLSVDLDYTYRDSVRTSLVVRR